MDTNIWSVCEVCESCTIDGRSVLCRWWKITSRTGTPSAQPSMLPGREHLVVWFKFLVTNTFLIWNVRWTIKLQSAQLKVAMSSKCTMATSISLQMWCRTVNTMHQPSVLSRTGLQQTYFWTSSGSLRVCVKGVASHLVKVDNWNEKVPYSGLFP